MVPLCVAPVGDVCGEAAVWSPESQRVYWVDINRFLVHAFDPQSEKVRSWLFDEPVVALSMTDEEGRFLLALGSQLIWWWPEADRRLPHGFRLPGYPHVRLNDGRADPLGNFWIGSMRNNVGQNGEPVSAEGSEGVLYRIAPSGEVTEWRHNIGISNTVCWSPDGRTFYFGDTLTNTISAYDFDLGTGDIGAERSYFSGFERGLPDGSEMDSEGYMWNCRYYGGCVVRVSPAGEIDRVIEMPVRNLTTAVFGGAGLTTLYVTSAANEKNVEDRLAGSLWALDVGVSGLPPHRVKVK